MRVVPTTRKRARCRARGSRPRNTLRAQVTALWVADSNALTRMHSLTCAHTHALTRVHSLTYTHSHALTRIHSLTCTHSNALTYLHSLTCTHSLALTRMQQVPRVCPRPATTPPSRRLRSVKKHQKQNVVVPPNLKSSMSKTCFCVFFSFFCLSISALEQFIHFVCVHVCVGLFAGF